MKEQVRWKHLPVEALVPVSLDMNFVERGTAAVRNVSRARAVDDGAEC